MRIQGRSVSKRGHLKLFDFERTCLARIQRALHKTQGVALLAPPVWKLGAMCQAEGYSDANRTERLDKYSGMGG